MIADTGVERAVLDSLKTALSQEVGQGDLDRLVVVRTGLRRRSKLYFVGVAGDPIRCHWVVKQPDATVRQDDLASPLGAYAQYQSLRHLHQGLARVGDTVRAPRPLAYLGALDAYAMEYVPGPALTRLIRPRALVDDDPLFRGVREAAGMLRAVHLIQSPRPGQLELRDLERHWLARGAGLLDAAGLPSRERWFAQTQRPASTSAGTRVLLHGDFAPENVILSPSAVYCLDPDLTQEGWAEHDVVRFLLMLLDAPFFVASSDLRRSSRLWRRATAVFLNAYYGDAPWPETLRPLMLLSLAARWATRDAGITERAPRVAAGRRLLVRRHFMRLLDEVASPGWPVFRR